MSALAILVAASLALDSAKIPDSPAISAGWGYGGLTVGLDEFGVLGVLRWPGPGAADQFVQSRPFARLDAASPPSIGGGRWAIEVEDRWYWLGDPEARTRHDYMSDSSLAVETVVEWPGVELSVRHHAGFPRLRDVFVSAIEVTGPSSLPRLVWVANFASTTRQIPEIPSGDSAFDATGGFVSFVDRESGRLWHFRPMRLGAQAWARARELALGNTTPAAWEEFGDGVWIGVMASSPVIKSVTAFSAGAPIATALGNAASRSVAVGSGNMAIEPAVEAKDGRYRAWIAIGVAANYDECAKALDEVTKPASRWFDDPTPFGLRLPEQIGTLHDDWIVCGVRNWMSLQALHDSRTGLTVRSLSANPPLARDWPRDGALVAWAYFESGDVAASEKSIEAYLSRIRLDDRPRQPFGSMPESLYTNGEPASAHFMVDDRGSARVLWVADRIVQARGDVERSAWVRQYWKAIEAAAEFLSGWSDARRGAPLYADDPVGLADGETQDRLFAAYAGMSAAIRLALYAGEPVPESWRNRQAQLLALVEWVLREPGRWIPGESLLLEIDGLSDEALGHVGGVCAHAIQSQTEREAVARLLLQQAILSKTPTAPSTVASALARIETSASGTSAAPDSLISAEVLLALLLSQ